VCLPFPPRQHCSSFGPPFPASVLSSPGLPDRPPYLLFCAQRNRFYIEDFCKPPFWLRFIKEGFFLTRVSNLCYVLPFLFLSLLSPSVQKKTSRQHLVLPPNFGRPLLFSFNGVSLNYVTFLFSPVLGHTPPVNPLTNHFQMKMGVFFDFKNPPHISSLPPPLGVQATLIPHPLAQMSCKSFVVDNCLALFFSRFPSVRS